MRTLLTAKAADDKLEKVLLEKIEEAGSSGVDYMELVETIHRSKRRNRSGRTPDEVLDAISPYVTRQKRGARTWFFRRSLLPSSAVARRLGVTQRTVQAWHKAGKLPGMRLPGGHLRFAEENVRAVETWAEESVLRGRDDPVLSELWDNKADTAYDKL